MKKYLIPIIAVFGLLTVWDVLFHGILMERIYLENSHLFRPQDEIQKNQNFLHLSNLIYSTAFCYIFSVGYESGKNIVQGIKYAVWVILLLWTPLAIHDCAIMPYPKALLISSFSGHIVETILAGLILASVYKEA